jgi:polyribonucleotide nucleotidyltransferase
VPDKLERQEATKAVEEQILLHYSGDPSSELYPVAHQNAQLAFDKLEKAIIRERIAVKKVRPDGRAADEIRPSRSKRACCPRTHGSALFTRGQTQALSVAALGTSREEMRLDTLGLETTKRYFHHYNFPPFSVGRPASCAAPSAATSGTARSRSGRSWR